MTLTLSGSVKNVWQIMRHVGWFGENSAEYYSRLPAFVESEFVAGKFSAGVEAENYQRHVRALFSGGKNVVHISMNCIA